jgi:hypothetical protein
VIVISGALVLVALVLLVIGLVSSELAFVYASIAVSVVSFAFLIVGILQRRGEQLPESGDAPTPELASASSGDSEGVTAIIPAGSRPRTEQAPAADTDELTGSVLVVAGRPRYHVEGCRYLTGKEPEVVEVGQARSDGFTACGVCKPDDALAAGAASAEEEPALEPLDNAEVTPDPVAAARKTTAKAPARKTAARSATTSTGTRSAAAKAPAKKAAAKKAAATSTTAAAKTLAKKSAAKKSAAKAAPSAASTTAAAKTLAKKSAAKKAASKTAAKKTAAKKTAARR